MGDYRSQPPRGRDLLVSEIASLRRELNDLRFTKAVGPRAPYASIYRDASLNISHNTETSLTWNATLSTNTTDTDELIWDSGGSTSRLLLPVAGRWWVYVRVSFDGNATGIRQLKLTKTGTTTVVEQDVLQSPTATSNSCLVGMVEITSDGTDYIVARVIQSSGGTLAVAGGRQWTRADVRYLGED